MTSCYFEWFTNKIVWGPELTQFLKRLIEKKLIEEIETFKEFSFVYDDEVLIFSVFKHLDECFVSFGLKFLEGLSARDKKCQSNVHNCVLSFSVESWCGLVDFEEEGYKFDDCNSLCEKFSHLNF